uniref:Uncharacterized protein n=1 Tax=Eptatretus burgeri TaxID=7764 RepID=A0A8C4R3M1_EPTBU
MGRSKHIGGGKTCKTGKRFKGKRRRKDLDEIHVDMLPGREEKLLRQELDPELPGEGRHYCLHCAYVPSVWEEPRGSFSSNHKGTPVAGHDLRVSSDLKKTAQTNQLRDPEVGNALVGCRGARVVPEIVSKTLPVMLNAK